MKSPPPEKNLTLSSDKTSILADGTDAATLSVIDNSTQKDVTAQATLYADDQPLSSPEFTSATPGSYVIKAVYDGVTSNTVTITAVSGESAEGISLATSKTSIYNDGGDFAVLTLKTSEGADVTAQGEFFADGEKLEGNRFSTTKGSLTPVRITATFNGKPVDGSVQITATSNYIFTSRMLFEDITKTSCTYCPTVIRLIEELRKDERARVVPYTVHNSACWIYGNYYSDATKQFADQFCREMNDDQSLSAAPRVYLNHSKSSANYESLTAEGLYTEAENGPKEVAIALESSLSGPTVKVKATIGTKKSFSGKVVAVLVENGIYGSQASMGNIEMWRTMKGYAPSFEGESKTFTTGEPALFETSFDLNTIKVEKTGNCEVIVFVTDDADGLSENVQFAKIGEIKGY